MDKDFRLNEWKAANSSLIVFLTQQAQRRSVFSKEDAIRAGVVLVVDGERIDLRALGVARDMAPPLTKTALSLGIRVLFSTTLDRLSQRETKRRERYVPIAGVAVNDLDYLIFRYHHEKGGVHGYVHESLCTETDLARTAKRAAGTEKKSKRLLRKYHGKSEFNTDREDDEFGDEDD